MRASAEAAGWRPDHKNGFPAEWGKATGTVDGNGGAWLHLSPEAPEQLVGIDTETLLAPGSDPRFAHQLMLYRVAYVLHEKGRMREGLVQFREDWLLLQQAGERLRVRKEVAEEKQAGDNPPGH